MSEFGVTDQGFVLKRMDTILEEIHADLTEGFGVDTRLAGTSFLNTLVTTFGGKIAELWEVGQDSYYAKYPATAIGVNLDNAVQYGGIRRTASKRTCYPLHCTGDDGAYIREKAIVATNTIPEVRLYSADEFQITRDSFNAVDIKVAAVESGGVYSVSINGDQYSHMNESGSEGDILEGLSKVITNADYTVTFVASENILRIEDTMKSRANALVLSDNLTTSSVTTIANFFTQEFGKITLPYKIVTKLVNNITGFNAVTNLLEPTYGRLQEKDIELRQSYIAKSALRSNTMIDSIVAELLNNVADVESASGYENCDDVVDARGLPPHSVEIIVEGGDNNEIAEAILRRKAGGIQTHGSITVNVPGKYGDSIPIHFNRPEYLYTWLKVILHGDSGKLPTNYAALTTASLIEDGAQMVAGTSLLTQLLNDGIYGVVAGITYVEIKTAHSTEKGYVPKAEDYKLANIIVTSRQKVLIDETRIEVTFDADS